MSRACLSSDQLCSLSLGTSVPPQSRKMARRRARRYATSTSDVSSGWKSARHAARRSPASPKPMGSQCSSWCLSPPAACAHRLADCRSATKRCAHEERVESRMNSRSRSRLARRSASPINSARSMARCTICVSHGLTRSPPLSTRAHAMNSERITTVGAAAARDAYTTSSGYELSPSRSGVKHATSAAAHSAMRCSRPMVGSSSKVAAPGKRPLIRATTSSTSPRTPSYTLCAAGVKPRALTPTCTSATEEARAGSLSSSCSKASSLSGSPLSGATSSTPRMSCLPCAFSACSR